MAENEIMTATVEEIEHRPNIILRIFWHIMGRHEDSEYEEYFEDIDPITFRTDPAVWNWYRKDRPGIYYYRQLQTAYELLLKRAGEFLLYDPEVIRGQFNQMLKENCELRKQLADTEGELKIVQRQLTDAIAWQTAQGRRNEVMTAQGLEPEQPQQKAEKGAGNRFVSNSGLSKQENIMNASAYLACGWELEEIAERLKLSVNTVRTYLATAKGHYEVKHLQGRKYIYFDSKYGNTKWDLCFYGRLEEKFTENYTDIPGDSATAV